MHFACLNTMWILTEGPPKPQNLYSSTDHRAAGWVQARVAAQVRSLVQGLAGGIRGQGFDCCCSSSKPETLAVSQEVRGDCRLSSQLWIFLVE